MHGLAHRSLAPKSAALGSRLRAVALTVLLVSPLAVRPVAAGGAFASQNADLVVIDLESAAVTEIGPHGLFASAFAYSADGVLYTAAVQQGLPHPLELWILDQETGEPTLLGRLLQPVPSFATDLTFDAFGDLWMAANGQFHAVDIDSAAAVQIGDEAGFLEGLAASGSVLYGIKSDHPSGSSPPWRLVEIDKTTGATSPIVDLPALHDYHRMAMDFDSGGRLWILASGLDSDGLFRMDDPLSGEVELVHDLSSQLGIGGLALILPPPAPTDVPVLDGAGLTALAALLLAAACWKIRRQRHKPAAA